MRQIPLYKERYIFVTSGGGRYDGRRAISWREAAGERLCLLSEDMQNCRIINAIFEFLEIKPKPPVVSNSFLGVCSYLRHGSFASIVPHTFFYVFGGSRDLVGIDLVEPAYDQLIGLVLTNPDPLPPMANALTASIRAADFENGLTMTLRSHI